MTDTLKICGLIDSLAPGGAQRQFVELMKGLVERGHQVTVVTYHSLSFFLPQFEAIGIPVVLADSNTKFGRIFAVRRAIAAIRPNVVVSFLDTPNMIAEVCSLLLFRRHRLIVSERSYNPKERKFRLLTRMLLHALADWVVSNSYSQRDHVISKFSFLSKKISTIHNCVDLQRFVAREFDNEPQDPDCIRLVVAASYTNLKNPIRFLDAFARLVAMNPTKNVSCDWYGDQYVKPGVMYPTYVTLAGQVAALGLCEQFRLHPVTNEIEFIYKGASALCLPSIVEGCSNAICEAMACGLPILASHVGDNAMLIKYRDSGLVFNPASVDSIYAALQ